MFGLFFSRNIRQRKLKIIKNLRNNMGKFKKVKIKKKNLIISLRRSELIIIIIKIKKKLDKSKFITPNKKK